MNSWILGVPLLIKFIGDYWVTNLFWQGVAAYLALFNAQVLDSYASFPAIDVNELSLELIDFYHNCGAAEQAIRPRPVLDRYVKIDWCSI